MVTKTTWTRKLTFQYFLTSPPLALMTGTSMTKASDEIERHNNKTNIN